MKEQERRALWTALILGFAVNMFYTFYHRNRLSFPGVTYTLVGVAAQSDGNQTIYVPIYKEISPK